MIIRWSLTLVLATTMAWLFRILIAERLQRAAQFVLPDTALAFDEFQAALAAQKAGLIADSLMMSVQLGFAVAAMSAAFACIHLALAGRPIGLNARLHWLWMGHSILPFAAVAVGLVAAARVG